jgi:hypothetical protein
MNNVTTVILGQNGVNLVVKRRLFSFFDMTFAWV